MLALHAFSSVMVGMFPLTVTQCEESVSMIGHPASEVDQFIDYSAIPHYVAAIVAGGPGVLGVVAGVISYFYAFQYVEREMMSRDLSVVKGCLVFKVVTAMLMCLGLLGICAIGRFIKSRDLLRTGCSRVPCTLGRYR